MGEITSPPRNSLGDRAGPVRAFDGYPYLIVLVMRQLLHIPGLPKTLGSLGAYRELGATQARANRLPSGVVLGPKRALLYRPEGGERFCDDIPNAACVTTGRLRLSRSFLVNDEQMERIEMLGKFIHGQAFRGFMLGDLTKGGQPATRWEAWAFRGTQKNGAPRGLRSCETCGDWRGRCLDPDPRWKGLVMTVACRCAND